MIYKYYGLQLEDQEHPRIDTDYSDSGISLGMFRQDREIEEQFLTLFGRDSRNVFLYSDYPEEEIGLGGGGGSEFVSEIVTNVTYGLVASFLYDVLKLGGKTIFTKLKSFLVKVRNEKAETIAIKIKVDGGADVTYKLPKYLTPKQIETAVERIEKETEDMTIIENRLWTTVIFDTQQEEFFEE